MAVLFGVHLAASSGAVPDGPDLTIKTRESGDDRNATVVTEVLYRKGLRQRRDMTAQFPASSASSQSRRSTSITQCDQRRAISLNHDAKTYLSFSIDDSGFVRRPSSGAVVTEPPPTGPEVVIVIDSVDTGERRSIAGYVARHVIRTRETKPAPGAITPASTESTDGWYIDLPLGCSGRQGDENVQLVALSSRAGQPRDRVRVEVRGKAPLGYPIESTERMQTTFGTYVRTRTLLESSNAPLAESIFAIPTSYRRALPLPGGGVDFDRADTLANRLTSYWELVTAWANYLFR